MIKDHAKALKLAKQYLLMTPDVVTHKGKGLATFKASRLICGTLRELHRNSFITHEVYMELADYITRQTNLGICATLTLWLCKQGYIDQFQRHDLEGDLYYVKDRDLFIKVQEYRQAWIDHLIKEIENDRSCLQNK